MIGSDERNQLMRQGWLVVPEVVPRVLCESVINAIEVFLNIRSDDPATWYEHSPSGHGIVPLHHSQALWNVRQYPAIHEVFADLYNTKELWVSCLLYTSPSPRD